MYKEDLALITYNGWYAIKPNQTKLNHLYLIYLSKEDLALNNQQRFQTQTNSIINLSNPFNIPIDWILILLY